jgi:hypothetical protein
VFVFSRSLVLVRTLVGGLNMYIWKTVMLVSTAGKSDILGAAAAEVYDLESNFLFIIYIERLVGVV